VAQAIQLGIEYDAQPPFRAGSPETAPAHIVESPRARMRARLERDEVAPGRTALWLFVNNPGSVWSRSAVAPTRVRGPR